MAVFSGYCLYGYFGGCPGRVTYSDYGFFGNDLD